MYWRLTPRYSDASFTLTNFRDGSTPMRSTRSFALRMRSALARLAQRFVQNRFVAVVVVNFVPQHLHTR
jgi:hypothetical protein